MKNKLNQPGIRWIALVCAFLGMGIAMPNCPGQQETKQQLETLQQAHAELIKKNQGLGNQITALNNDMNQVKQILPQITQMLEAHKNSLDRLNASIHTFETKGSKPSKGPGKKRR